MALCLQELGHGSLGRQKFDEVPDSAQFLIGNDTQTVTELETTVLRRLKRAMLYVGPAALMLGSFGAAHLLVVPETDRLLSYRIANGLIEPPVPEPPPEDTSVAEGDNVGSDETVQIIPPAYSYFSFTMPFTANVGTTLRLFSMEVSLSFFGSPFEGDVIVLRLKEMEAQLRPVVLAEMEGFSEHEVRDPAARDALAIRIRDALNANFRSLGEDMQIDTAIITSVIVT
jgi:flagellar basal body-associated protein FliL